MALFTSKTWPHVTNGEGSNQQHLSYQQLGSIFNFDKADGLVIVPSTGNTASNEKHQFSYNINFPFFIYLSHRQFINWLSQCSPFLGQADGVNEKHNLVGPYLGYAYHLGWTTILCEIFVLISHTVAYRIILKKSAERGVALLIK